MEPFAIIGFRWRVAHWIGLIGRKANREECYIYELCLLCGYTTRADQAGVSTPKELGEAHGKMIMDHDELYHTRELERVRQAATERLEFWPRPT